jgi:hypothetical protein
MPETLSIMPETLSIMLLHLLSSIPDILSVMPEAIRSTCFLACLTLLHAPSAFLHACMPAFLHSYPFPHAQSTIASLAFLHA